MLAQLCRKAGLQLPRPQSRRSSNSFCISCISRFSFLQSTTKKIKNYIRTIEIQNFCSHSHAMLEHDDYCKAKPYFIITFGIAGISKETWRRKNEWRKWNWRLHQEFTFFATDAWCFKYRFSIAFGIFKVQKRRGKMYAWVKKFDIFFFGKSYLLFCLFFAQIF